jgi:hypothetical protein
LVSKVEKSANKKNIYFWRTSVRVVKKEKSYTDTKTVEKLQKCLPKQRINQNLHKFSAFPFFTHRHKIKLVGV